MTGNPGVISDSIFIGDNTVLEGDPTAVIKLEDNANWPRNKPLITQIDSSQIHGVTIKGFEINGNHDNQDQKNGEGYYNMIYFHWGKDIQVHDMYMHNGNGDGLRVEGVSKINFYDNKIYKLGHDGLFTINSNNVEAWSNNITCRTDSGLRTEDSNHVEFHDNLHSAGRRNGFVIFTDNVFQTFNKFVLYFKLVNIWLKSHAQYKRRSFLQ